MNFDYKKETQEKYKDSSVAKGYHVAFTNGKGVDGIRFKIIAYLERRAVYRLARKVPHATVIDAPTGTGKMAPVFKKLGSQVLASDISSEMLDIAKSSYKNENIDNTSFVCVPIEELSSVCSKRVDLLACVRLFHRVPKEDQDAILESIQTVSKCSIITFAFESKYQKVRRFLRLRLIGGNVAGIQTWRTKGDVESHLRERFDIIGIMPIGRLLSSQWAYLLRSRG